VEQSVDHLHKKRPLIRSNIFKRETQCVT
jgi:hypothetical protein